MEVIPLYTQYDESRRVYSTFYSGDGLRIAARSLQGLFIFHTGDGGPVHVTPNFRSWTEEFEQALSALRFSDRDGQYILSSSYSKGQIFLRRPRLESTTCVFEVYIHGGVLQLNEDLLRDCYGCQAEPFAGA